MIEGYWKDTGKLEDMLEANRIVLDTLETEIAGDVDGQSKLVGKVRVAAGARIINSTIRGPVIIGEGTVVENAYIGPFTSVYYGCTIRNCELEHSVVLENSMIVDIEARVEDSLIGKNVRVGRSDLKPRAYRFMLGDNSEVGVV
jgi:glucose-1-phosphate thymidylyltransferase